MAKSGKEEGELVMQLPLVSCARCLALGAREKTSVSVTDTDGHNRLSRKRGTRFGSQSPASAVWVRGRRNRGWLARSAFRLCVRWVLGVGCRKEQADAGDGLRRRGGRRPRECLASWCGWWAQKRRALEGKQRPREPFTSPAPSLLLFPPFDCGPKVSHAHLVTLLVTGHIATGLTCPFISYKWPSSLTNGPGRTAAGCCTGVAACAACVSSIRFSSQPLLTANTPTGQVTRKTIQQPFIPWNPTLLPCWCTRLNGSIVTIIPLPYLGTFTIVTPRATTLYPTLWTIYWPLTG